MSNITKKIIKLASLGKTVFTTNELAIVWKVDNKNVLRVLIHRAIKNDYLRPIRRGLYRLPDREADVLELAGKLKKNSYASFETVLARSGVIFQWYDKIISASDRNLSLKNSYGKFLFRRLPENVLLDRQGIINKGGYFIATAERALCDKIYKDGLSYFDDLSGIDKKKIMAMAKIYNNKRLEKDIKRLFNKSLS